MDKKEYYLIRYNYKNNKYRIEIGYYSIPGLLKEIKKELEKNKNIISILLKKER